MQPDRHHKRSTCRLLSSALVLLILWASLAHGGAISMPGAADLSELESSAAENDAELWQLAVDTTAQEAWQPIHEGSSVPYSRRKAGGSWVEALRAAFGNILGGASDYMQSFLVGGGRYTSNEQKRRALKEITIPHIIHQVSDCCSPLSLNIS